MVGFEWLMGMSWERWLVMGRERSGSGDCFGVWDLVGSDWIGIPFGYFSLSFVARSESLVMSCTSWFDPSFQPASLHSHLPTFNAHWSPRDLAKAMNSFFQRDSTLSVLASDVYSDDAPSILGVSRLLYVIRPHFTSSYSCSNPSPHRLHRLCIMRS